MYQHYYKVLCIPVDSGLQEIKKAYRTKAKEFHPDINKSSDAKERFIEINEAYEFLINNQFRKSYISPVIREQQYRDWIKHEREKARARAAYQARKKFEQFRRSPIYKTASILSTFYDFFSTVIGIIIIIGVGFGLKFQSTFAGGITPLSVIAGILLFSIGLVFIIFSLLNYWKRTKIFKRRNIFENN
jgi:DnaJ-class molecular chaperone